MILLVGEYPPPINGASVVASRTSEFLTSAGHEVLVVRTSVPAGSSAYHLRRALRYLRAAATVLLVRVRGLHPVLYQTGAGGLGLYYQAALIALARLLRTKTVFHHHSYAYLSRRRLAMTLIARVDRGATHILLSDSMEVLLRQIYGVRHTHVVSNALFVGDPSLGWAVRKKGVVASDGHVTVGHLSNLSLAKGLGRVIETADHLRKSGLKIRLKFAGTPVDAASAECLDAHLSEHPDDIWLGPLDRSEVTGFMRGLDCFLMPSSYGNEAMPLVVLEALREGTPVVASDIGCLPDLLGVLGWSVELGTNSIGSAALTVLMDPTARAKALNAYRLERAKQTVNEYVELITGARK